MVIEGSGSPAEEGQVVQDIRTNNLESDDVLDFEPYQDEPNDEADPPNRAQSAPAEDLPNRSDNRKKHLIGFFFFISIYFLIVATELYFADVVRLPSAPQPLPTQPPPPNRNYSLNFPEVYPKLDPNRSSPECRAAWETLTDISCHEGIWLRLGWWYSIFPKSVD